MTDVSQTVLGNVPEEMLTLAATFKSAAGGEIYIGKVDADPTVQQNQIQVYIEDEGKAYVPVTQPLLINTEGHPVYHGKSAKFVMLEKHSMAILDADGVQQFYYSDALKDAPSSWRPAVEIPFAGAGSMQRVAAVTADSVQDSTHALTPEMFGAKGDGIADDTKALQDAINSAISTNRRRVVGMGQYKIKQTLQIKSVTPPTNDISGLVVKLSSLVADSSWPQNTNLFDAKPMITIGDATNDVNVELSINHLDGAGKADGLQSLRNGFSMTRIHIGHATNCIRVIGTGKQQWSNASVYVTGNSWRGNWVGVHLERGTVGTSPINEGWDINVGFIWSNRYGGLLLRGGSQYARVSGDFDFNGNYVSLLKVDSITGVTRGMKLTNGTTECYVLAFYHYRGENYIALAENKVVAQGNSSYAVGDKLTSTGTSLAINVVTVITTKTNATKNNFFDIWHDFQGETFAAVNIRAGYCGGVHGALQHTSRIFYNNNFEGRPDNWRGFGVANSGNTLTMYDKAKSDVPFAIIDAQSFNLDRRLFLKTRLYEGTPVAKRVPSSHTTFTPMYTFSDQKTDKYFDEGCMYEITLKGNFGGTYGRWLVFIKDKNLQIIEENYNKTVFEYQFSDLTFQLRQSAQPYINVALNIRRV